MTHATPLPLTPALLAAVVEGTTDAVFVKDAAGRYLLLNEAAARFVGRAVSEVLGLDDRELFDAESARLIRERDARVMRTGAAETMEEELRSAGVTRTYSATKAPLRDGAGEVVGTIGISRDITDRKRAERLIQAQNVVWEKIAGGADLKESMAVLVGAIRSQIPGASGVVMMADAEGTTLRVGVSEGFPALWLRAVDGMAVGPSAGSCGTSAHRREPVWVADMLTDPLWQGWRQMATSFGFRSGWCVPILDTGGQLLGTIGVYRAEPGLPDEGQRRLMSWMSHAAAVAIGRQRSEEALRERKEQLRLFIEQAPVAIGMFDTRMRYLATSGRWRSDYGLGSGSLVGRSHYEVFPEMEERWREVHRRCLQGAVESHEADRFVRADGSCRWLRWEVRPWYTLAGAVGGLIIFSEDITERRRVERRRATEHAVARVLAEAKTLAEAMPRVLGAIAESEGWDFAGLWRMGPGGRTMRSEATWKSPRRDLAEMERTTRSLVLARGQGFPGRVWKEGRVLVVPELVQDEGFVRRGAALTAGLRSAVGVPIRANGALTGVLDFLSSVRVEPSPELEESLDMLGSQIGQFFERTHAQEELMRFVALNPAVLYALRVENGRLPCFWVSENLQAMTGYRLDQAVQSHWWSDHIHPEDRARVLAANRDPEAMDRCVTEFRLRHADGNYRWVRDEKRVIRDARGKPCEVLGAWSDITERVQLEAQLRQSQKMEALGLLSGGIAHDFNNILATILGETELALQDVESGHPVGSSLREIERAGRRAATLVRQILAFARREPAERQVVDLRMVVEDSVRLLRSTLPAGIELRCSVPSDPCFALLAETQIEQAFLNLGTNAWHAIDPEPGRISVELETVEVGPAGSAGSAGVVGLRPGWYHRCRMVDTGRGMDAATMQRIFDPFFTTKSPERGSGLGLSVVHGIVKAHGGSISVSSVVGVGTTFDLYFAVSEQGPGAAGAGMEEPPRGYGERILVIDDDAALVGVFGRMLERLGYRAECHHGAGPGLEAFRRDPGGYDVVLSDLNMPSMSGIEVARVVAEVRPELPVLVMSGTATEEVVEAARRVGVRSLIAKPVRPAELSRALRAVLPGGETGGETG